MQKQEQKNQNKLIYIKGQHKFLFKWDDSNDFLTHLIELANNKGVVFSDFDIIQIAKHLRKQGLV